MFTQFNPANFVSFDANTLGSGVDIFTSTEAGTTLTYKLTSVTAQGINPAGAGFTGVGILSEDGFDDTAASFSLNTNAGAGTFITFNTAAVAATPEPNSLILLGSVL